MSIGAEFGQYILQTHNSKKIWGFNVGLTPLTPLSEYSSGCPCLERTITFRHICTVLVEFLAVVSRLIFFSAVPFQTDFLWCIGEIVVIIDTFIAFSTNFLSCVL